MKLSPKLIFVTPWYGKHATGGAETLCRTVAEHLHNAGLSVEIFTTCSKQFQSNWENDYEPGTFDEEGLIIRRFRVDKRNTDLFNNINSKILSSGILSENEE